MTQELSLLLGTTIAIAFVHTITGPDHYVPFTVIAQAKKWGRFKTIWFTALCGVGHVGSSIILGLAGIALGLAVNKIQLWEGIRGSVISYVFTAFGLIYLIWGLKRAYQNRLHTHLHLHKDDATHIHEHTHHQQHTHIHEDGTKLNLTPWILFTIFVFGPCEPLIPLVMYPAAKHDTKDLIIVTIVFSVITIITMIILVLLLSYGFKLMPMKFLERYSHALAGGTILLCGLGMLFLGL
jgi:nickel/cobalt transporter (NicO) family protein